MQEAIAQILADQYLQRYVCMTRQYIVLKMLCFAF